MIKKIHDWPLKYLIMFAVFLGVTFTTGLISLMCFKNIIIDETTVNLLDMYIKAGFAFFGSFFSGLSAMFVFYLQRYYKNRNKIEVMNDLIFKSDNEKNENINAIRKIDNMFRDEGIKAFVNALNVRDKDSTEKNTVKEILEIVLIEIDFSYWSELEKRYGQIPEEIKKDIKINEYKSIQKIFKYLSLLLKSVNDKNNQITLCELIEKQMKYIDLSIS